MPVDLILRLIQPTVTLIQQLVAAAASLKGLSNKEEEALKAELARLQEANTQLYHAVQSKLRG